MNLACCFVYSEGTEKGAIQST